MTLDDLSPDDLDLAESVCGDLPLPPDLPDDFAEHVAARLAAYDPDLAERLLDLSAADLAVLHEYLRDRQAVAATLAVTA